MEAEEGSSNGDNGEGVGLDWRLGSQDGDNGGRILGGNVVEVLAVRIVIPWIIGSNQAHVFTKRFIKSS